MNSRERIEAIFAGETPDRVGRYEQSIFSSVASEILGRRAYSAGTGLHRDEADAWLAGESAHEDFVEQLITDRAELGEILGFDMMGLPWRFAARPTKKVSENEYLYGDEDGEWDIYKYDEASETFGKTRSSRGRETLEDIKSQVRRMEDESGKEGEGEPAYVGFLKRLLSRYGDKVAVLGAGGISIPLEEEWLMATATDPGVVGAFLDMFAEGNIREMRRQAEMGVKIIWAGGDLADNAGPVYGPNVFRELLLPRLKRVLDECHRLGMWYVFRSDGNLWSVTDMMFTEAGVDGYGEIDWAASTLPLWERLFMVTTEIRLSELGNLNLPLIRDLVLKAPGTYNHSIAVGTLCEGAAKAIGLNPLFLRIASLYHDVGKSLQPEYFIENQKEGNPHDKITPLESARFLKDHVTDGMAIARKAKLPSAVVELIPQHHGTKLMRFFYEKAKSEVNGSGEEVQEDQYRYPGPKPQTKAAAILMLADGIEAAARTLNDHSQERLFDLVQRIMTDTTEGGQLAECDITLSEINRVTYSFLETLSNYYHSRIAYPGLDFNREAMVGAGGTGSIHR